MNAGQWLVILLATGLGLVVALDWSKLKQQLTSPNENDAVRMIIKHWPERPDGFFKGIRKGSWEKIVPKLSIEKIEMIRTKEFKYSKTACKVFSQYLPRLSNIDKLPKAFRFALYRQLPRDKEVEEMESVIRFIPAQWVRKDGPKLTEALVSLRKESFKHLNDKLVKVLLADFKGACGPLTVDMLKNMSSKQLEYIQPRCIAAINNLDKMDLSLILREFPKNSFSEYNGPLSRETLEAFTKDYLKSYGSSIKEDSAICQSLELHLIPFHAFESISARCLYGYLSRKWNAELGSSWSRIPLQAIASFAFQMHQVWTNIHPNDFPKMPELTYLIILFEFDTCKTVDFSVFTLERIGDVSPYCLHGILSRVGGKVRLGHLWKKIQLENINFFTEKMMESFKNLDVTDFVHMPDHVLEKIFHSDAALANLPSPIENIIVSSEIEKLDLSARRFAAISKAAPVIAGQLLMKLKAPPKDILAECDGSTLRNLVHVTAQGERISWDRLFLQLEKVMKYFSQSIELMSSRAEHHFCSTIKDIDEYLSLTWLHRNISDACRSKLPFSLEEASVILKAPELVTMLSWKEMLKIYKSSDWDQLSKDTKRDVAIELCEACEFWISACKRHYNFLKFFYSNLKFISPHCVLKLRETLKNNCDIISGMADDAFALYKVGEFPCRLKDLSSNQIAKLSKYNLIDGKRPSAVELSQHVLSQVTKEELVPLSDKQFKALINSQRIFLPEKVTIEIVKSRSERFATQLNRFVIGEKVLGKSKSNLKSFLKAMKNYSFLQQFNYPITNTLVDITKLIGLVRDSSFRGKFLKVLGPYEWTRGLIFPLCLDANELHDCIVKVTKEASPPVRNLEIPFENEDGFDRESIIEIFHSSPDIFANPQVSLIGQKFNDFGGPMRILTSQLLADIQRDLIVPGPQIFNMDWLKDDTVGVEKKTGEVNVNSAKFVWCVNGKVGFMIGLVFGKALQLGIKLPFALDPAFYTLLIDNSKESIEKYYRVAYEWDIYKFEKYIRQLRGVGSIPNELAINSLTKPEHLRYTTLSIKASADKAKVDYMSKTNLWSCGEGEGFRSIQEIKGKKFLQKYFLKIREKTLSEFQVFIDELIRGLGLAIPPVKHFNRIPISTLQYFIKFLPELLNAEPIRGQEILDNTSFTGDNQFLYLKDQKLKASQIFSAFIRSLDQNQVSHLVGIWTGASTINLRYTKLEVVFVDPGDLEAARFNFCEPVDPGVAKDMAIVSPGAQYLELFKKFIGNLPKLGNIKPDCNKKGVKILLGKISTCGNLLTVYLQPLQSFFNSLVYMLNTQLANIIDS